MSQLSRAGTGIGIHAGAASSRTMLPSGSSSYGGSTDKLAKSPPYGKAAPVMLAPPVMVPGLMGNGTSSGDGRTLLNSVRDENQSGEHLILPNSMVTVLWP